MKRVTVLALLLAIVPFAWTEEPVMDADEGSPTESAAASVTPAEPAAPAVEDPAATSQITPVPAEPAEQSTVTPVSESVEAPPAALATEETAPSHKVVKGDTLWDLAGAYLKNPFLWPKILDANREKIQNPNLIFPNQEFVIPSAQAAAALETVPAPAAPAEEAAAESPSPAPASEPVAAVPPKVEEVSEPESVPPPAAQAEDMDASVAPPRKMIEVAAEAEPVDIPVEADERAQDEQEAKKRKTLAVPGAGFMGGSSDSFLADETWEYDGYVLRDRDQRMMISQGDVVFLNIGAASGVKPKMVAHLYRVGKKVKDPYLKKKAGRMIKRVGAVMVTGQITEEGCTAVVTNSLEPIRIGDIVKFVAP